MTQGGVVPAFQYLDLHGAPLLLSHAAQLSQSLERCFKNLLPAVRLSQQRHGNRAGLPQQNCQDPPLLCVEVGKAVDENVLTAGVSGDLQTVTQLGHSVPGVQTGPPQAGLVSAVQQTQVEELVMGRPRDILGLSVQIIRRDFIAPQLVKQVQ